MKAAVMCEDVARTVHIAGQLGQPLPSVRPGGGRAGRGLGAGGAGAHELRTLKLARFGDNMRDVAVTEGDTMALPLPPFVGCVRIIPAKRDPAGPPAAALTSPLLSRVGLTGDERVSALEAEAGRLEALGTRRLWLLRADQENELCL